MAKNTENYSSMLHYTIKSYPLRCWSPSHSLPYLNKRLKINKKRHPMMHNEPSTCPFHFFVQISCILGTAIFRVDPYVLLHLGFNIWFWHLPALPAGSTVSPGWCLWFFINKIYCKQRGEWYYCKRRRLWSCTKSFYWLHIWEGERKFSFSQTW